MKLFMYAIGMSIHKRYFTDYFLCVWERDRWREREIEHLFDKKRKTTQILFMINYSTLSEEKIPVGGEVFYCFFFYRENCLKIKFIKPLFSGK